MTRPRVPETDQGIQGEFNVTVYDQMQRRLRDKGWIETSELINHGITQGCALPGQRKSVQGLTLRSMLLTPPQELVRLIEGTKLERSTVSSNPIGLTLFGTK